MQYTIHCKNYLQMKWWLVSMGEEQFNTGFHGRWENKKFNASKPFDYARTALVVVNMFLPTLYRPKRPTLTWTKISHRPSKCLRSFSVLEIKAIISLANTSIPQCHLSNTQKAEAFIAHEQWMRQGRFFPPNRRTLTLPHIGMKWFKYKSSNQFLVAFRDN